MENVELKNHENCFRGEILNYVSNKYKGLIDSNKLKFNDVYNILVGKYGEENIRLWRCSSSIDSENKSISIAFSNQHTVMISPISETEMQVCVSKNIIFCDCDMADKKVLPISKESIDIIISNVDDILKNNVNVEFNK